MSLFGAGVVYLLRRGICHFAVHGNMCKCFVLLCVAILSGTDGATVLDNSIRLRGPAGSTDDILQALATDVAPTFDASRAFAAEGEYVEDRRRMLDA